jgi:hypothetical protein
MMVMALSELNQYNLSAISKNTKLKINVKTLHLTIIAIVVIVWDSNSIASGFVISVWDTIYNISVFQIFSNEIRVISLVCID